MSKGEGLNPILGKVNPCYRSKKNTSSAVEDPSRGTSGGPEGTDVVGVPALENISRVG